eukprot:m.138130 g.138130  ORF g.138130 m.138130 type:complete len:140 (+) comp13293_c0_seq1:121-540(+)
MMSQNPAKKAKKTKTIAENLPAGFFDDVKKDAQVRNVPLVNKDEEDWKQFQKDIAVEEKESAVLIEEDAEEATINRIMEEMNDQKELESRVEQLRKKRETIKQNKASTNMDTSKNNNDSDSDDSDSDWEDGNWRDKSLK